MSPREINFPLPLELDGNLSKRLDTAHTPVGVRIRDAKLVFDVLLSEEHLEPDCHFAFLNVL